MIERILAKKIGNAKKSILLLGPRQTGKSTLIHGLKPDVELNLADQQLFLQFSRNPREIFDHLPEKGGDIFIDEVQRIPSLLNTLQTIIDKEKSKYKFYLTGSSARKLGRGQANLLPGRIISFKLSGFCAKELDYKMDLKQALSTGCLPGIYLESENSVKKQILSTYVSTYLAEEIRAEALTRDVEGFSRFLEIISIESGNFVDYSKLASNAYISIQTARRYFEILEDTLLAIRMDSFAKSTRKRLIKHPKFYFFDVGVYNALVRNYEVTQDRIGVLFEHFVVGQIHSSAAAMAEEIRLSTYRTSGGAEVDIILEKGSELIAIECKASKNVGPSDLRGLKSFAADVGGKPTLLVCYLGDQDRKVDGIHILPWKKCLQEIGF